MKSIKTEELLIQIELLFLNNPPKILFVKTAALKNSRMHLNLIFFTLFKYQTKKYRDSFDQILFDQKDGLDT